MTCQPYQATGSRDKNCSSFNTCRNCDSTNTCWAQETYPTISLSEYGRVVGDENIQREIHARGPVACYLNSDCIHNYSGGVSPYNESYTGEPCKVSFIQLFIIFLSSLLCLILIAILLLFRTRQPYVFNHAIQLAGWGTDVDTTTGASTDYWIGR